MEVLADITDLWWCDPSTALGSALPAGAAIGLFGILRGQRRSRMLIRCAARILRCTWTKRKVVAGLAATLERSATAYKRFIRGGKPLEVIGRASNARASE